MKLVPLLWLACAPWAAALEARDTRGLAVQLEVVPGPVSVDGVLMQITVARGSDVTRLASRIEQRWRREGSALRAMHERGWQLRSRWEDGRSELIQWRGDGEEAQLLHSVLDTVRHPSPAPGAPFPLPAGCEWGRVVEGSDFLQRSAYCRTGLSGTRTSLRALLDARGWSIRSETAVAFELQGQGWSGSLTLMPGPVAHSTALAWLGVRAAPGVRQ